MKNPKSLFVLPLAALSLASCGSQSAGKDITIDGQSFHVEVGKMVIGMECDYAPFNWTATAADDYTLPISTGGYADGYDIQMAKRLSTIMGLDVSIVREKWESLIPDCQMDSINMVIAGMTDTEERRESIAFSDPYFTSEVVLLSKASVANTYQGQTLGREDLGTLLSGRLVVSQKDTVEDEIINNFVTDYGCQHASAQTTYGLAADDVRNGSADFLVVELPVAQAYVSNYADSVGIVHISQDILGVSKAELSVSIGVKKENTGLVAALNAALSQISADDRNTLMTAAVERAN